MWTVFLKCLFAICFSSLVNCQNLWPNFWLDFLLSYCWVLRVLCVFWILSFIRCVFCMYFLLFCGLSSHSVNIVFHREVFKFNEVQLNNYFFHELCLWFCVLKVVTIPKIVCFVKIFHYHFLNFTLNHWVRMWFFMLY